MCALVVVVLACPCLFHQRSIRVRDSKFGKALVIETSPTQNGAGFVLGFRVDPAEKLPRIYEEISNLHSLFTAKPVFGVDHESEEKPPTLSEATIARVEEKLEVLDTGDEISDAFAAYYADEAKTADREVIFSPGRLGGCVVIEGEVT